MPRKKVKVKEEDVPTANTIVPADPYTFMGEERAAFPSDISIDDIKIRLNADGTYEGDAEKFMEAAKTMKVFDRDGILVVAVWAVINALKNQKQAIVEKK